MAAESYIPILQVLVSGVSFGLILALLGAGMTLIFGLAGIYNLAQGQLAVLGSVFVMVLLAKGFGFAFAPIVGIGLLVLVGLLVDRGVLRIVYKTQGETRLLLGLFITLGIAFVVEGYYTNEYPNMQFSFPFVGTFSLFPGFSLPLNTILAGVISLIVIIVLQLILGRTNIGRAIRGVSQNEMAANLVGINPSTVRTVVLSLGVTLAGVAGLMEATAATIGPGSGADLTLLALVVSVVGGLYSINGTLAAGVVLGVVFEMTGYLVGTYVSDVVFFGAAILTILVKPEGILSR